MSHICGNTGSKEFQEQNSEHPIIPNTVKSVRMTFFRSKLIPWQALSTWIDPFQQGHSNVPSNVHTLKNGWNSLKSEIGMLSTCTDILKSTERR